MSHETQERALAQRHAEKKTAWTAAVAARDEKLAEMRRLTQESRAVLDKAKTQKRSATAAEESQLADLDQRCEALEPEISRLNAAAALAEQEYMALPTSVGTRMPVNDNNLARGVQHMETATPPATGPRFRDLRTGQEIRALLPHERVVDTLDIPEEHREARLGRWMQAQITGKWEAAEKRLLDAGSAASTFVPHPIAAQVIDLARARSVFFRAGAPTIPMTAPTLDLVRVTGDPTVTFFGGDETRTSGIPESQGTFGKWQLQSQTAAFLERVSIEAAELPNFPQVIESQLGAAAAAAIDQYILYGSVPGARDGIRQWLTNDATNSLNEVTSATNGDQVTDYSKFISAAQKNLEGSCPLDPEQMSLIWAPRTWGTVAGLKQGTTNEALRGPDFFERMKKLTSTAVKITETQGSSNVASTAFLGDMSQVLVGVLTDMTLESSRVAGDAFSRLHVLFRLYFRLDFVVMQPKFITRITGLIP